MADVALPFNPHPQRVRVCDGRKKREKKREKRERREREEREKREEEREKRERRGREEREKREKKRERRREREEEREKRQLLLLLWLLLRGVKGRWWFRGCDTRKCFISPSCCQTRKATATRKRQKEGSQEDNKTTMTGRGQRMLVSSAMIIGVGVLLMKFATPDADEVLQVSFDKATRANSCRFWCLCCFLGGLCGVHRVCVCVCV